MSEIFVVFKVNYPYLVMSSPYYEKLNRSNREKICSYNLKVWINSFKNLSDFLEVSVNIARSNFYNSLPIFHLILEVSKYLNSLKWTN